MKVHCFLPCREGSVRVTKKNIMPFNGNSFGLVEVKLQQLLKSELIDEIVLSSNDDVIIDYATSLNNQRLRIHRRSEYLCTNEASTDDLVAHALELIPDGHILWTHVTSPFINEGGYDRIITDYQSAIQGKYDSLMTTTLIHGFIWDENGPFNYNRSQEKWPRTQTIPPLHEVNSAVFLSSADNYRSYGDRIGLRPLLYPLDRITGFDIDWPDDFVLAECIAKSGSLRA